MNTDRIKQILDRLAKRIVEIEERPIPEEGLAERLHRGLPTVHGGAVINPELVEARVQALHDISAITEKSGVWGPSSVDFAVWNFTDRIAASVEQKRQAEIHSIVSAAAMKFAEDPSSWVVDILIYGIDGSCDGMGFGKIRFVREDLYETVAIDLHIEDFPRGVQMFARLEVSAIDKQSAIERAESIIDEHLMVLNAICVHSYPSLIQVARSNRMGRSYSAHRAGDSVVSQGIMECFGHNLKMPLSGQELSFHLNEKVGRRVNQMLASGATQFNTRVLRAFQFAGAGCVDPHLERSFVMFAIALESAVLGKDTKSELTYQLGSRVAHLIGNGLEGRRLVAKTVNELYSRRSVIVHTGEYGVPRSETALMQYYCFAALGMLAAAPTFADFKTNADLEKWFKDRMLNGPNHFQPEYEGAQTSRSDTG